MAAELLPPDAVNLADDRVPCPSCAAVVAESALTLSAPECSHCHGKGTIPRPTGRDALSHTLISSMLNCAQRHDFEYVQRLELITRPKALSLGAAFQYGIEHSNPEAAARKLRAGARVVKQEDEDRLRIDETTVEAAARLYLSRWPSPADEVREYEYRVRLRNPETGHYSNTFDLRGYADGVIDQGGYLELVENKLVGSVDKAAIKRLKLDRQVSLACYGLWRATGKPVRVVHYRHTRKPSIKQRQTETVEQFCARLADDYADAERREFYTHEEPLFRSTDDLLRTEQELWEWADELRRYRRRDVWPRNTSHCHDYGGCAFIPICCGDPDAHTLYRVREPRPEIEVEEAA